MSEHTAGPCECRIRFKGYGGPGLSSASIEYCPTHATAPETTDMLEQAAAAFAVLANRAPTYEQKDFALEWFAKCKSQIAKARGG